METKSEVEYSFTWKGHIQHIRESFTGLLQNNDFCDVTLYAEGQKIGAHKVFLAACSGYFKQLFEDLRDERPIIVLKGVQFEVLKYILGFIYNGQVSLEIDKLNAFLEAAKFLKIYGVIKNKIVKKRAHSLVSETDHGSNTGVGVMSGLTEKNVKSQSSFNQAHTETYYFKRRGSVQRPLSYNVDSISIKEEPDSNINAKETSTSYHNKPEADPRCGKYSLDSPQRTGEWTSDYENLKQSTQSNVDEVESALQRNVDDIQNDEDCTPTTTKKRKIISEKFACNLEEIESFNESDFANSLDAEIEFSDENEEDYSLEKEMLKTSLASTTADGFRCNICHRIYVKKDSLKKHFAVHTKNTTCTICGMTLSRRSHLKRHLKIHRVGGQ